MYTPRILRPLIALAITSFCFASHHKDSETKSLFNGKNLDGWIIENDAQFSVADGVLKVNRGTGWLRSEKTYSDCTIVIQFRFLEEDANSGVFVRTGPTSKEDEDGWPDNGYQIQCRNTINGTALGFLIPYGAPAFQHESNLAALKKVFKPTGEWQAFRIVLNGEELSVFVNDALVTTATDIKNASGHIGIQGEKGLLEFRKIEVSENTH
jgi:hypothetical protein